MPQAQRTKLETGRPVHHAALPAVGKGQWPGVLVFGESDLDQADIVLLLAAEGHQGLLDFLEQCLRLTIGLQQREQTLLAERLTMLVTGFEHAVSEQKNAIARRQRVNLAAITEPLRLENTQRQMT